MKTKFERASFIAVAATLIAAVTSAEGSGAAAQASQPIAAKSESTPQFSAQPVVQPLPEASVTPVDAKAEAPASDAASQPDEAISATSLAALVADQPQGELSRELDCLAGAIYFEAKGESLPGQLAVGRVIVARSKSGRFPSSYCGVVFQPSQFSFVRGNAMPGINRSSRQWQNAVAVARIADEGSWRSPVEGALFFHAAYVSPRWRLTRMARVDNHVFYR